MHGASSHDLFGIQVKCRCRTFKIAVELLMEPEGVGFQKQILECSKMLQSNIGLTMPGHR